MGLLEKKKCWQLRLMLNVAIKLTEKIYWTGTYGTSPKPVSSITTDKVIQVLTKFFDTYNNADIQASNNDSPFNRKKIQAGTKSRDISLQTIPPHHPFSEPVENLIRL